MSRVGDTTRTRSRERTNDTLPEVVGLALGGLIARELPVDFVLDVGHGDERGHDTAPTARLDCVSPAKTPSANRIQRNVMIALKLK